MDYNHEPIVFDTTPQELTPIFKQLMSENFIKCKREERNKLLDKSDKYTISDFPITTENKMKILTYRQNLRDFDFNDFSLKFPEFPI
jgi:hypothetical protein